MKDPGYLQGDAVERMKELDDKSVDLIITDPPYESLEKHRSHGTTTRLKNSTKSSNSWFPIVPNSYFGPFFKECFRVLKKPSHLYVFCDPDTLYAIRPMVEDAGFAMRKPLVWHKVNDRAKLICECGKVVRCKSCGQEAVHNRGWPGMGYPYRATYEQILFAQKGRRKPSANRKIRDVLEFRKIKHPDAWPTEKPVKLIEVLIGQSSEAGDLILDPFAGSGATLKAAKNLNRLYQGFDIQEEAIIRFQAWLDNIPPEDLDNTPPEDKDLGVLDLFR